MHQIGAGVLGPVFRAYPPDRDELVVLKALHLDLTPEQAKLFSEAVQKIAERGPSHPSLVRLLSAGVTDDGVSFLASAYVAAESLDVAIRHYAPAPPATALPFIVQLADAFDVAHDTGLTHGALHLRDIFVTPDRACVSGFGVVPALERVGQRGPIRRPYTAPEVVAGTDWGPPADRFSLAAVAYELLTGRRAGGTTEQMVSHLEGACGAAAARRVAPVFVDALAAEPAARPASSRAFADRLADAVPWSDGASVREASAPPRRGAPNTTETIAIGATRGLPPDDNQLESGTRETVMPKRQDRGGRHQTEPEVDWTEQALDHGVSDELRQPEAYEPRPIGAPPGFERPTDSVAQGDSEFEGMDATRANAGRDTPERPTSEPFREGDEGAASARPSVLPGSTDAETPASDLSIGTLLDQYNQLDERSHDADAGVVPLAAMDSDVGNSGQTSTDPTGKVDASDEDEVAAIQARYRTGTDRTVGGGVQAPQVYAPIVLTDLEDRVGRTPGSDDDLADESFGEDPDTSTLPTIRRGPTDTPSGLDAGPLVDDDEDEDDDGTLPFGPGAVYGETDEFVSPPSAPRRPSIPVAVVGLVGVATVVTAFVIGFGWMAGGDAVPSDEGALIAAGVTTADEAEPVVDDERGVREFSEASVGEPVVSPAPITSSEPDPVDPLEVLSDTMPSPPSAPAPSVPGDVAPPPTPAASESTSVESIPEGRLLVRSMPPGATVAVNGENSGVTPLALTELPYGDYELRVLLAGHQPREYQLRITDADPIAAVNVELSRTPTASVTPLDTPDTQTVPGGVGSIFVDTRPQGVAIWLDQRRVGETPMLIPDVTPGPRQIEFRQDGYRTWATTVLVRSSEQARVTASLVPAAR
ncbi:MAG: PEGA domain-containing protein [Acidobacteriota bacterium]|nr:PEGA domain-containing protein [Acidobacteriota bacterium]